MKKPRYLILLLAAAVLSGCEGKPEPQSVVRLATTTSVRDSGLLDELTAEFQKGGRFTLQTIAVGSGQAMQMGRMGEADLLWVHSPDAEERFVEEGFGIGRVTFLHNDFVILGPAADPAKIRAAGKAADAMRRLAAAKANFVSRGDKSGTHSKELKLLEAAGVKPGWAGYLEAGQGMAGTLSIANEKAAYVLADRSTYLSMKKNIGLVVLYEGDEALINRYSLILANPARFSELNVAGARAFYDFVLSNRGKAVIETFGADKYGAPLFHWDLK